MKSVKEKKKELLIKSAILLGISVLLLIVAIYLGNIMHSDDTFVETYFFPQAGEGSAFFFWNSMIFFVISFVTFINIEDNLKKYENKVSEEKKKIKKNKLREQKLKEAEKERLQLLYDSKCEKIFNKYIDDEFDIDDDETNNLIAKNYGCSVEELIQMYNRGKEMQEEAKKIELLNRRKEQNESVEDLEDFINNYCGIEVYYDALYESRCQNAQSISEYLNDALIDDDLEKLKKNIEFKKTKYEILDTNNFLVYVSCFVEPVTILKKDAIIDGYFKVLILDEDGNEVAKGYYSSAEISCDKYMNFTDFYGMDGEENFSVLCSAINHDIIDKKKKYNVQIEILNLWALEKSWSVK